VPWISLDSRKEITQQKKLNKVTHAENQLARGAIETKQTIKKEETSREASLKPPKTKSTQLLLLPLDPSSEQSISLSAIISHFKTLLQRFDTNHPLQVRTFSHLDITGPNLLLYQLVSLPCFFTYLVYSN
jgi:hypothetical protein